MQCSAVQCSAVQCSAVQCSAVQCSAEPFSVDEWHHFVTDHKARNSQRAGPSPLSHREQGPILCLWESRASFSVSQREGPKSLRDQSLSRVFHKCFTEILPRNIEWFTYFSKHRPSGPMLSISWNVRLSVRVSVCLSVCVFTFEVPFNGLFAPTSWSWMSNIFRDSESLGKSSGKKWSQIWTFLFENCLKSPRKKTFFLADFTGYNRLIPLICEL